MSEMAPTLPLRAASCYSAGAIAAANHNYQQAREAYEDAVTLYERSGAPYESARARLALASILVMLDRLERARDEVTAARQTFENLNAAFYSMRTASLLQDIERRLVEVSNPSASSLLLTERQIEILRLISQGMNDREIAAALVVSEHTVHRHVANILQRLNLPSRAAAVGYASSHDLISG
jgi:DNA-binding NarL/FixJ family response regulator